MNEPRPPWDDASRARRLTPSASGPMIGAMLGLASYLLSTGRKDSRPGASPLRAGVFFAREE
jgi:hypothetical protein